MDKDTSFKLAEAICEELDAWTASKERNDEKIQKVAAILRADDPAKPRTEYERTYCEVAVMVRGQITGNVIYLRKVADALERGAKSGMTGTANPSEGRWLSDLP